MIKIYILEFSWHQTWLCQRTPSDILNSSCQLPLASCQKSVHQIFLVSPPLASCRPKRGMPWTRPWACPWTTVCTAMGPLPITITITITITIKWSSPSSSLAAALLFHHLGHEFKPSRWANLRAVDSWNPVVEHRGHTGCTDYSGHTRCTG